MPHIILEYSPNATDAPAALLDRLHRALGDDKSVQAERVKSRAIAVDTYLVGTDGPRGFVHATVLLSDGRPAEMRRELGARLLAVLGREACPPGVELARSVEIRQFEPGMYFTDFEPG